MIVKEDCSRRGLMESPEVWGLLVLKIHECSILWRELDHQWDITKRNLA